MFVRLIDMDKTSYTKFLSHQQAGEIFWRGNLHVKKISYFLLGSVSGSRILRLARGLCFWFAKVMVKHEMLQKFTLRPMTTKTTAKVMQSIKRLNKIVPWFHTCCNISSKYPTAIPNKTKSRGINESTATYQDSRPLLIPTSVKGRNLPVYHFYLRDGFLLIEYFLLVNNFCNAMWYICTI